MMNNGIVIFISILLLVMSSSVDAEQDALPILTITSPSKHASFSSAELLAQKNVTHINMSNNRAYPNMNMDYQSIRLCDLLKPYSIQPNDMLEFIAADHFSVLIPAKKVMACDKNSSIGYLAIEPAVKWPLLRNHTGTTAGPFDVIWLYPEKSYISNEYWAWSVVEIQVHKALDKKIFLMPPNTNDAHIRNGYDIYIEHCAGCHALNHIGKGVIGPDLNLPKSPVEYYPDDATLKKYIRNPDSVKIIKNNKMNGSGVDFLSEKDLNDLILYFHYMAKHKSEKQ